MLNTILFDLDGTLIPMSQEAFVHAYFAELTEELKPLGYDPEALIRALWHGTGKMVKNDGSMTNREAFWNDFCAFFGEQAREHEKKIDRFYGERFDRAKRALRVQRNARPLIEMLQKKGYLLVLATNPVFPGVAVRTRLRWVGLEAEDFSLITDYSNSRHCKPNPLYYQDILQSIGRRGEECMMVGNNVREDMVAQETGMQVFLLTDDLENESGAEYSAYPQGDYEELFRRMEALPAL